MLEVAAGILSLVGGPLGRLLGGERGETIARAVTQVARTATGAKDDADALATLRVDPQALAEARAALMALERAELEHETERLREVNATMRAELASEDAYVRRWRPHWGYVTAWAWGAQVGMSVLAIAAAAGLALWGRAGDSAILLKSVADLWEASFAAWGIALTVLGLNVTSRSRDKAVKAGHAPTGILDMLAGRFGRRGA